MRTTSGPWTLHSDGGPQNPYWQGVELHAGPLLVARMQFTNAQGQGKANAQIVAAAPELLEALKVLLAESLDWQEVLCVGSRPDLDDAIKDAQAAIRKVQLG